MSEEILARAEEYLARRRNRMRLLRAFTAMALVVAIMTSYVLMLPGLTLQADAYCGYEEHAHTEDCYTLELTCTEEEREPSETIVKLLQCSFKPHEHTEHCMTAEGVPGCGVSTAYWHRHTAECYDEAGTLVCTLANNPKHVHDDSCYVQLSELTCTTEETPGHVHDSSCYGLLKDNGPTCGLEENDGHVHAEDCTRTELVLTCDVPVTTTTDLPDHVHVDACYTEQTVSICTLAEGEGAHTHTDACYPVSEEPTCGLIDGEGGHAHGNECYVYTQGELDCDKLHQHNGSCYDPETGFVICGKVFLIEHNHSAYCLRNVTAIDEGHTHADACYIKNYTCGMTEHAHTPDCFVAPEPEVPEVPTTEPVPTTDMPTVEPTAEATVEPTVEPTAEATVEPTVEPTAEATVEPTVEPTAEATVEPTVEPTVEATVEPTVEPTAEATVEPTVEPTVEATVEPTVEPTVEATVEPTAEPTESPETTPAPEDEEWNIDEYHQIEDFLVDTFYCGLSAHTHDDDCRDESGALICGYEMEHVHDATCTVRGNKYHCGKSVHSHDEYCRDDDGVLICDMNAHVHTIDCLYACGKIQHSHTADCLNEAGEQTCGLEEHTHDAICAVASAGKETTEEITSGKTNFDQYIADSKWNTADGVSIKPDGTVVYDPTTDSYTTDLQISFAIPNYVLRGYTFWNGWYWQSVPGQRKFYYEIPEGITINDGMLDKPFPITSPDGTTIEGTFYIRQDDAGNYYLDIEFSEEYVRTASAGYSMPGWPVNQTPYSQGNITFEATLGSEHVQEDSSIRIEFTEEDVLEIPAKDIEYPEDDKGIYNIATEKSGSYIREGNKLYYKVLVHSDKGTPSHVKLDDKLLFNGITVESFGTPTVKSYTSTMVDGSWQSDGNEQTLSVVKGGPAELTDTTATYNAHQGPAGDIKYDMHLPKIEDPGDGKRFTYEITYEINLEDVGLEFNGNGTNTVTAKSESKPENKVQSTASSNVGINVDSLTKVGSYDQQNDLIKWSVTVNAGAQDIAGAVLTDEMFTTITEANKGTIVVKDANGNVLTEGNGYQINTDGDKVTSIEFFGTSTEDGVEVNRNKYVIEYYTTPTKTDSEYTEYNNAKLEKDDDETTEQGGAYVKRDLRLTKQNTGASMSEDGTKRIIDWTSSLTVYDNGLTSDLVVKDTLSGENHYMSADQVVAFYDSLTTQSWFNTGANNNMVLTYTDADGETRTVTASEIKKNPSAYADCKFTEFTFTIVKNQLPTEYNGKTIEMTYQSTGDVTGLDGTAYFNNTFGIGTSSTGASHEYTHKEIVKVDKMNYWDGQDELYVSTSGTLEWHINVTQDKEYQELTVTDTLPPETVLDYIAFGPYGDGRITFDTTNFNPTSSTPIPLTYTTVYHEKALKVTGTYVPATGVITMTFTRNPDVAASDAWLDGGFGAGETLKLKVFASIKDEYKPSGENGNTSYTFDHKLTNKVNVHTEEGKYGEDEHSYNVTITSSQKVTKMDGTGNPDDTTVITDTGELSWSVKVYQDKDYKSLTITDRLPTVTVDNVESPAVELTSIKIGQFLETTAIIDVSKAVDGVVDLEFENGFNDGALSYEGTYNLTTGVVTIKVTEKSGMDSPVFGNDKTLQVNYYAQVKDEHMPDTEDGEYVTGPFTMTNNVNVTTNEGDYGNDSQTQTVTVKKEEPKKETVGKNHTWTPSMNLLHYSVDLNPTATDLDPSKNMLTVTDKITYVNDPDNYDRELSLIKSSVRLYYADYDANGVPLRDENGRLVKGVEVPYSDWTMAYSETLYENNWQQSDCTMVLTVPDERALILEYDYRVSMKYVMGWDNEIRLTNTVTIEGYDGYSDSTDSTDKWEEYNAGGIVSTEKSFSFLKIDASNHAKVIPGATFTVYRYDAVKDEWIEHAKYVTEENGSFMVQWQQNDADLIKYTENVAYKIVETQPALGYILDPNPIPYYFYWANANIAESSLPENWLTEYSPRELVTNPGHVEVENIRRTTETEVTKIWQDADGNPLSDDLKKPVTVHLKRYAIPADVWKANEDKYNHGLSSTIISVAGAVRNATTNYPSFNLMCYAGSTVSFDVVVLSEWVGYGYEALFTNLPEGTTTSKSVIGSYTYFHFDVPVHESIVLDGWFKDINGQIWPTEYWNNGLTIQNVQVITGTSDIDDTGYAAELDQYRDRNYTNTMTLTAAGGWHGVWENLDLIGKDAAGNEVHYKYYVIEDAVDGFSTTITGGSSDISGAFVVTNTYDESKTEPTSLKVIKIWTDENGDEIEPLLDAVEIRLYQKDELTGKEIVYPYNGFATTVINDATNWQFNFRNLPYGTWDKSGNVTQLYTYRIEEVTKGNFVTQIIALNSLGEALDSDNMNGATVQVINSEKHPVSAEVIKVWSDGNDTHSGCSVTVRLDRYILTQDGYELDETFDDANRTQVLSASNNWKFKWEELPDSDDAGNGYQYRVVETLVDGEHVGDVGYIPLYSTTNGYIPNDGSTTITNKRPDKLTINKTWLDKDGNVMETAPDGVSVTMELWRTTEQQPVAQVVEKAYDPTLEPGTAKEELVATFTMNNSAGWEKIFTGLPSTALSGEAYHYYIKELKVEGYTTTYEGNYGSSNNTITVKNQREDTLITHVNISKQWVDVNGTAITPATHTAVYYKLYEVGDTDKDITSELTEANGVTLDDTGAYIVVTAEDNWTLKVEGLTEGSTYRVEEYIKENGEFVKAEGAVYSPASGQTGTTFFVTNRLTDITVEKVWKDVDGNVINVDSSKQVVLTLMRRATSTSSESATYTETALQTVTLPVENTAEDGSKTYSWSTTIKELQAGDSAASVVYTYYFVEKEVPTGFDVSYSPASEDGQRVAQNTGTFTVTNTQQTVSFSLEKVWKDKAGNVMTTPPTGVSIAFYLMRKGTGEVDTSGNATDEIIEIVYLPQGTQDNPVWTASFDQLPKTDLEGNAYEYYIREGASNGMTDYVVTYSPAAESGQQTDILDADEKVTVTNQLQPKQIRINVMKRWTSGSTVKDVTINVYRYILTGDNQKVVDPTYKKELTFKTTDTAAYQTVSDPDFGSFVKDNVTYTGDFHYYVEEQNVSEDYTVTYSYVNEEGETVTVSDPKQAALNTDGNLRVTNHERSKLNVRKVWNGDNITQAPIEFELYRTQVAADDAGDDDDEEIEFVDVKFRIIVLNTYPVNGQMVTDEVVLTTATRTFAKGSHVVWQPSWACDVVWYPTSANPQSIVYKTDSNVTTPINFVDTTKTSSPYVYGFDVGYVTESGTVTWTTDNWFQNGNDYNGLWSHSFVVDGAAEVSTLSLRAMSRDGETTTGTLVGTFTLDGTADNFTAEKTYDFEYQDGGWNMLFYDLPILSDDGAYKYLYKVVETTGDYLVTYTNNDGVQTGEIVITNSPKEVKKASVTVKKEYSDGSTDKPDVTVELYRSVTEGTDTFEERVATVTLKPGVAHTWNDLLFAGSITQSGKTISSDYTYYVKEIVPTGYTVTYSTPNGVVELTEDSSNNNLATGSVTITNTPKTGLTVNKEWANGATAAAAIKFALKRSATPKNTGTSPDTVDVTFQIVYDYVTTDPTTGATQSGRKVLSSQTETIIKGATVDWKPTWQNTNDDWHPETGTITYNGKTIEFSEPEENADEYDYTFHLGDVNAGGTVIWIVNGDFVNDAAQGYTWTQNFDKTAGKTLSTHELSGSNGWKMTFYDLIAADDQYTYTYSVEELTDGYDVTYTPNTKVNETTGEVEGTITITNSPQQPETTFVKVEKKYLTLAAESEWPQVTVRLYKRVTGIPEGSDTAVTLEVQHGEALTLNAENGWKGEWKNLPIEGTIIKEENGKTVSVTGKFYYRIEEVNVPAGYELSYSRAEGKVPNKGTVVITNRQITQITVAKAWVNQDAAIAPEIEFNLIQKAVPIASETATINPVIWQGSPFKLNADNSWQMAFAKLPLVSDDGLYQYEYSVEETALEGYTVAYSANSDGTLLTITNTRPLVSVTVDKVYDAPSYQASELPKVEVKLVRSITQNGVTLEEVVDTQTLTAGTPYTWTGLRQAGTIKAADGTSVSGDYTYSVRETVPLGFSVSYSTEGGVVNFITGEDGAISGTVTITNTEQTQLKVEKVWHESVPEAEQQEIQFKLWRTRTENTTTVSCPECKEAVPTEDFHAAKCGNSEHYTCDKKDHSPCTLCGNGYVCETKAEGTPAHGEGICFTDITCFNCGDPVKTSDEHVASCEQSGHYTCNEDGFDHSEADCGTDGHYKCDGLNHGTAACNTTGHYACDGANHGWCTLCGVGYVCEENGTKHGMGVCYIPGQMVKCPYCQQDVPNENSHKGMCGKDGHWTCWGAQHYSAPCGTVGHYVCDGQHGQAGCGIAGHYLCDGKSHDPASWHSNCGGTNHYMCDGLNHTYCEYCSGYYCDGNEHGIGKCRVLCPGCEKPVETADEHLCGSKLHYTCVTDGWHVSSGCGLDGHYYCDGKNHNQAYPCNTAGHYYCDEKNHEQCEYCDSYLCDGKQHGLNICALACEGCKNPVATANEHLCASLLHYTCVTDGYHVEAGCGLDGHYYCDGKKHEQAYPCYVSGHYYCDDKNHEKCSVCGEFACNGDEHGEGYCDVIRCPECKSTEVASEDEHALSCGHYTCMEGYTAESHKKCSYCARYVCDGNTHQEGVCDVGVEIVGITFVVLNNNCWYNNAQYNDEFSFTDSFVVGSTVKWTVIADYPDNKTWHPAWEPTFTYGGSTYTATTTHNETIGRATYTTTFTVTVDGTVTIVLGNGWQRASVSQTAVEIASATLTHTTFTRTATAGSGSSADFGTLTSTPRASDSVNTSGATQIGEVYVLNAENGWEHIFYELPQYSSDGKYKYTYFVQEITPGYDVTYSDNNSTGIVEGTITITNTKKVPTTKSLAVTKQWQDESGNAYTITTAQTRYFKLLDNRTDVTATIPGITGATLSDDGYIVLTTPANTSSASFTVKDVPIGGAYTFEEYVLVSTDSDGTKTYAAARDYTVIDDPDSNAFTIVNKLTDITINKVWGAASNGSNTVYSRPDVTFELWRTLADGTDELVASKVMKAPATAVRWDMLPLTDGANHTYTYYVKEVLPTGFIASDSDASNADGCVSIAQGGAGTITNTPTELNVTKAWQDVNGVAVQKPNASITYQIIQYKVNLDGEIQTETVDGVARPITVVYSTATLTSDENGVWVTRTHYNLPHYWTNEDGTIIGEYRYDVVEVDSSNKQIYASYSYDRIVVTETTVEGNTTRTVTYESETPENHVDVSTPKRITIINTETEIHVKKIWSIAGGALPETLPAITLQLRYTYTKGVLNTTDTVEYETVTLTADTEGVEASIAGTGEKFWTFKWTNLPTHDIINGEVKQRLYYVVETVDPDGFMQPSDAVDTNNFGIAGNTSGNPIEITNMLISYVLPETGGAGTTPYTVCGLLLMLAAMALMYKERTQRKLRGEGRES